MIFVGWEWLARWLCFVWLTIDIYIHTHTRQCMSVAAWSTAPLSMAMLMTSSLTSGWACNRSICDRFPSHLRVARSTCKQYEGVAVGSLGYWDERLVGRLSFSRNDYRFKVPIRHSMPARLTELPSSRSRLFSFRRLSRSDFISFRSLAISSIVRAMCCELCPFSPARPCGRSACV